MNKLALELEAVGFAKETIPATQQVSWVWVWTQKNWGPLSQPATLGLLGAFLFIAGKADHSHPSFRAT